MRRSLLALALLLAACGDDDETTSPTDGAAPPPPPMADSGVSAVDDAGASQPAPANDAARGSDGNAKDGLIPLILWVDDLIDHHTNDSSNPDTVEDKRIAPTEDPTLFDKYFQ